MPGAIAASAIQINIFVSGILVSHVNGARSWLAVCDRLYQLPQGLVGVAVGVALLPRLSRAVHAGDKTQARGAIDEAITFSMALTLPAAAALVSMPFFLIDGLYTRGAFKPFDAHDTALALQQYGWGVPAFVLAQITSRAFFAQQDTATPMRFALVSVAVNIAAGRDPVPLHRRRRHRRGHQRRLVAERDHDDGDPGPAGIYAAERRGLVAPGADPGGQRGPGPAAGRRRRTSARSSRRRSAHLRLGPLHAKEIVILASPSRRGWSIRCCCWAPAA